MEQRHPARKKAIWEKNKRLGRIAGATGRATAGPMERTAEAGMKAKAVLAVSIIFAAACTTSTNKKSDYFRCDVTIDSSAPDRDPALLQRVNERMTVGQIAAVLGDAHADVCSGVRCPVWYFAHGMMLEISSASSCESPDLFRVSKCETVPCKRSTGSFD